MATGTMLLLLATVLALVSSFTYVHHGKIGKEVGLSMREDSDLFSRIPSPFAQEGEGTIKTSLSTNSEPDDLSTESLIGKAKALIATDLAVQDPTLLAENFRWIGPLLEKPLGKVEYLAAGRFFGLRTAFPDLDYRPYDFRVDENDSLTVRCTVRPLGVMRGPLRLRNELVQPNGKQWQGPPEAISMTFDAETGKVIKLCSGFAMDRFVGNTNGLCGVMAAATIAGVPPSAWEVYPIPAVISRFFGRPVDPVGDVSTFLAPFPETVMIQLVKGILTTSLAAEDPALLTKDFSFVTPLVGPIGKNKFLESYAGEEFGGFEPQFSHFRVDPYDPYRVWVDVKPVGPGLEGPPQAFSFTFDDDGFCTRMTAGAVMDPSIGNTGGLTGAAGIKYAIGEGDLDFAVRPLPVAIGRLKKTILSPVTNILPDEYVLEGKSEGKSERNPTETRKALAEARALTQEEESKKMQLKAVEEARLQTQKEREKEKIRMEQETEQEKLERAMETQSFSKTAGPVQEPEVTIPTPPKVKPSAETVKKAAAPPPTRPAPKEEALAKTSQPKDKSGSFFADALEPLSSLSVAKPPSVATSTSKNDAATTPSKEDGTKQATAEMRSKQKEQAEQQKANALKQREAFEEARLKRLEKRKQVAEQKRIDLERRKKAAEEARAQKAAETNAAIAKRKKEAEEKRLEAEKKRQDVLSKSTDAITGAFSAFQSKPYPMASKSASKPKRTPKPPTSRAEVKPFKPASKTRTQASAPRPSFQMPQLTKSETKPKPKSSPTRSRPSFQIPQFGKAPYESKAAREKPESPPKKNRPSFQIPQFSQEKTNPEPTRSRPSITIPKFPPSSRPPRTISKASKAPKGIPTIAAWKRRPNSGISGQIFGSTNFIDGERVETSTIAKGEFENGNVVTTESGSKYFLSGESVRDLKAATATSAPKPSEPPKSKPRATLQLTKQAKERDAKAAKAALEAASKASSASQQKRPTFSLAALFGMDQQAETKISNQSKTSIPSSKVSRSPVVKKAPKGVPSIGRWKQNRDKSITGFITGSPSFPEGERITTSPIARGVIEPGEVLVTSSGTKYFLQ